MPKVHHPRPGFTGAARIGRRSLEFTDGVAELVGPAASWRRAGYTVTGDEDVANSLEDATVAELRDLAAVRGVDVPSKATKADIIWAIKADGDND